MSDLLTIYIDMELKALKKEYQNQTCIRLIFYLCTLQTNKNNNKQTNTNLCHCCHNIFNPIIT